MRYGAEFRGLKGAALACGLVLLVMAAVGATAANAASGTRHLTGGRSGHLRTGGPHAGPPPSPTPTATVFSSCAGPWYCVASPSPGTWFDTLNAIAGVASSDLWAVGSSQGPDGGSPELTLTEHWNGTTWSLVSSPNGSGHNDSLNAVAAVASNDVWAVGADDTQALTEHWNGSAWSVVPSPTLSSGTSPLLVGVAAISSNDVWAVGSYRQSGVGLLTPLAAHWDGTGWSVVPTPSLGLQGGSFNAIATVAANDVWAVGWEEPSKTLTEHWDGKSWSIVSSPNPSSTEDILSGVVAISSQDVWAVGHSNTEPYQQSLTEHWDGTSWSTVPGPNLAGENIQLLGVAATSTSDVWAVGFGFGVSNSNPWTDVIGHWNGTSWSLDTHMTSMQVGGNLYGVVAFSPLNAWAVGHDGGSGGNNPEYTLAMHFQQFSPPSMICVHP